MNRRAFLRVSIIAAGGAMVPLPLLSAMQSPSVEPLLSRAWPSLVLDLTATNGEKFTHSWLTNPDDWRVVFDAPLRMVHSRPLVFYCLESCIISAMRMEDSKGTLLKNIYSLAERHRHLANGDSFQLNELALIYYTT